MQLLLNQLVYFGFFQSLLLLVIYMVSPKKRKHINGYMAIFIGVLSIGLLGKVLHSLGVAGGNFRLISMSELSALLFGPSIYLFCQSVLRKKRVSTSDLVHYLPGAVYSVFVAVYFVIPSNAVLAPRIKSGELMRVVYACHAVGLIVNIMYWIKAWHVFQLALADMRKELSYEPHHRFLKNFLIITGICLLIWTILLVTSFFGFDMLERNTRPYIWIILTLIILFVTYYGMVSPQVLRIIPDLPTPKYNRSKLSHQDLEQLKRQLDTIMLEKKPYLNSKLMKSDLAEMLGVNSPELARLLNENIGMNFFEYVNYYRIKEFVAMAKTDKAQQLTFYGLAQEAGFNSKTTFNKAFKKLMGTSPSTYFNSI